MSVLNNDMFFKLLELAYASDLTEYKVRQEKVECYELSSSHGDFTNLASAHQKGNLHSMKPGVLKSSRLLGSAC